MSQIKFIRTTHEDGRFRPFPTAVNQFWRDHGWIVGDVLRPETGMSFAEIVEACNELIEQHPEIEPHCLDIYYLAWCLVRLLEYGMVSIAGGEST